eukprot:TRINITY_DN1196_c0_g1_i1.p1 TRINITY_DN1196_c0_g1~~TRINITY_DN1196_c0_g1_i1.p1  ORF type:complete len:398 (+),score=70.28 TRINITY_DN1196_c0_g1_i1:178-1371(+)
MSVPNSPTSEETDTKKKRGSLQQSSRKSISEKKDEQGNSVNVPAYLGLVSSPNSTIEEKRTSIVNIDPKQSEGNLRSITSANLDGLLVTLKESVKDSKYPGFAEAFIATHSYFLDSLQLASKLMEFFYVEDKVIAEVFFVWIDIYTEDFKEEMMIYFNMFLTNISGKGGEFKAVADRLHRHLNKKIKERQEALLEETEREEIEQMAIERTGGGIFRRVPDINFLLTVSAKQMAMQLSLAECKAFREIPLREFLHMAWQKGGKDGKRGKLLARFIDRSNRVSWWIATCVLVVSHDKKKRRKMIQFWIEVITECININNFQTALQLFTGLNLTPVQRLKSEWKDLSKKSKVRYQEIQTFFDPEMNYKRYREKMKKNRPTRYTVAKCNITRFDDDRGKRG